MSDLSDLQDRLMNGDPNVLLGRLCWYSVSDLCVPHDDVVRALVASGISTNLPQLPTDDDVFRRVCSSVKRQRIPTADPDVFENYLLREFKDKFSITKRIVRERVNSKGKRLEFTEMFDVTFSRSDGSLQTKSINGGRPICQEIAQEIETEYATWRGCVGSYTIREWIRAFVLRLGATRVRPGGGVYFLREDHVAKLAALEEFGNRVPNGVIEFHYLPLIDDRRQREMLRRAFESEASEACDQLIGEMQRLTKDDKKITADRYAGFVTEYQQLLAKSREYSDLLEATLDSTGARLSILQKQVMEMRLHVKEEQ